MRDLLTMTRKERVDLLLTLDPLDRVTWDGQTVDAKTAAVLHVAGRRLGYDLSLTKGSYLPADANSGQTHTGGGVGDLPPFQHRRKVKVFRDLGVPIWYRGLRRRADGSILWTPHEHFVIAGHQALSGEAATQVVRYDNGENGLADRRADPNPYRPSPKPDPFNFRAFQRDERLQSQIMTLKGRVRTLQDRISAKRRRFTYRRKGVN